MYSYKATVVRWIDGDTVVLLIDLGFHTTRQETVRLYGVDTPELNSSVAANRERASAALLYVQELAPKGSTVLVQSLKPRPDYEKFGRWLALMFLGDGRNVAAELITSGHGVPYHGGPR